jgi:hypothetical protein
MQLFSYKNRPAHLGAYPLERLKRTNIQPDLSNVPPMQTVSFADINNNENLVNAMASYEAMLDAIRDGMVQRRSTCRNPDKGSCRIFDICCTVQNPPYWLRCSQNICL